MVAMSVKAQKELQELKKEIQDVNWKRKSKQLQTGDKLNQLNQQWVSLVSCNYEIEQAIAMLEQQIQNAKLIAPRNGRQEEEEQDKEEAPTNGDTNGHHAAPATADEGDVEME